MAATPSSNTLMQSFFSSTTSVMSSPSTSSIAGYSSTPNYSQGIGYSPSSRASSGIPSFRSLRSLLPFGTNKNATITSDSSPNNIPRSPFGAFGSIRRSMTKDRDRKVSLSNDVMMPPVIAIEKLINDSSPDDTSGSAFSKSDNPTTEPSPCGDELASSHIEADNSGASKFIAAESSPNAANRNVRSAQGHNNTSPASRLPRARHASFNPSSPSPQSRNSYNTPRLSSSPATSTPLRYRDGSRTPSLRLVDTTTAVVRNRTSRIPKPPARMRKRSMSFQDKSRKGRDEDTVRSGSSLSTCRIKTSGGGGVEGGSSVNESSASAGPKMEWLGPRTAKAFRAAGLLDFDREAGSRKESEPFSAYGGASSHGGGSSYAYSGLMESPTRTVSSGSRERDTPKSSVSTAPTSLADPFAYLGRDRPERDLNNREREREREQMKEKHGNEMGALLGALSDSQRTVRVLREENSDLRDRLERFTVAIQASEELRHVYGDLQSECSGLRRENIDLKRELVRLRGSWSGGNSSGSRTPIPKAASSGSQLARTFTSKAAHEEYDDASIDRRSEFEVKIHRHPHRKDSSDIVILPPSSPVSSKKRRLSNSSSLFPIPPSDMTLLLHEDVTSTALGNVGGDHSQHGFSIPPPPSISSSFWDSTSTSRHKTPQSNPPISYANFVSNVPPNSSVTSSSVGSISPSSTADFSINTGSSSPGSLVLRPEHEILLGDMESLDLGVGDGDGDGESR